MEQFYDSEIEVAMKRVYDSFSEKDKRIYAAIEVKKLSYGGLSYISNILDCDPKTLYQGLKDLEIMGETHNKRKRQPGGGRKRIYREGQLYTKKFIEVYDHDFESLAEGDVLLYGIYDEQKNTGFINIGSSKDTSEFVCDTLRLWWETYGRYEYPQASSILALADGGGSNSSRHYIFKEDLQKLVEDLGIEIRMAHYPPYTSKWNPIEHRLFPHVTKAMKGVILKSYQTVEQLIQKTKTKTGLFVRTHITHKDYQPGRKVQAGFKKNMKIVFDEYLPKWNYTAIPSPS